MVQSGSTVFNRIKQNSGISSSYTSHSMYSSEGSVLSDWKINMNTSYYQTNNFFSSTGNNIYYSNTNIAQSDTGQFPISMYSQCYTVSPINTIGRLSISLPVGTYTVSFLWSPSSSFSSMTETQRQACHYRISQGNTQLGISDGVGDNSSFVALNNVNFHNEITFTNSNSSTAIDLSMWSTLQNARPGWNLIKITKLS